MDPTWIKMTLNAIQVVYWGGLSILLCYGTRTRPYIRPHIVFPAALEVHDLEITILWRRYKYIYAIRPGVRLKLVEGSSGNVMVCEESVRLCPDLNETATFSIPDQDRVHVRSPLILNRVSIWNFSINSSSSLTLDPILLKGWN